MKYKNTRTGAVIDSLCNISGKYWVKVEERTNDEEKVKIEDNGNDEEKVKIEDNGNGEEKVNTDEPDKVTDTPNLKQIIEEVVEEVDDSADGIDGITVKEIKQELDAFGIKYDPRMKKQELYELMLNGK